MIIYRLRIKTVKQNQNAMKRRVGKAFHHQRAPAGEKGHGRFAEPRLGAAYGFSHETGNDAMTVVPVTEPRYTHKRITASHFREVSQQHLLQKMTAWSGRLCMLYRQRLIWRHFGKQRWQREAKALVLKEIPEAGALFYAFFRQVRVCV